MSVRTTSNSGQTTRAFIVFGLLFIILVGCQEQSDPKLTAKQPIAVNVITLTKVNETLQTATYFGALEENRNRTMGFTVPGKLKSIAKRGQTLGAGEILADLNVDEFEEQRKFLQSQLSPNQNQQDFQQLQQRIAEIDEQIQARRISAPYDCVVDEVFAFENSLIGAQSPVVRVIDLKNPRVRIDLPRKVASFIRSDMEVFFLLEEDVVIGKLAEKSQTEKAGSIQCLFDIKTDLSNNEYKFGQTVESRFNFKTNNTGFWLPLSALDRSGEGVWSVLLVETKNGQNIVSRKLVTIVQITDDQALIDGDILENAIAVADGTHRVVPGQEVEPRLILEDEASGNEEARE